MSVVYALLTANLALLTVSLLRNGGQRRPSSLDDLLRQARVSNSVVSFRPRGPVPTGDGVVVPFRSREELVLSGARQAHPSAYQG